MAARLFKKNANTPLPTTISHPSDMITQVAKPSKQKSALGNLLGFTKCFAMLKTFNPKSKSTINPKVKTTPAKLGPQPEHLKGRKTLILDLDETLVHSTLEYTRSPDFVLPLSIKGVTHLISIHKRPGVEYFLERVCQLFEVVIFTASLEDYAKPLIKKIDRTNQISSFLYRGDCTVFNNILVKDLSTLGRDLKDIILIDNSANSFLFQPQNAYQIKDFFDDKKDQELAKLLPFLEHLAQVDDVRSISGHYRAFEKMQNSRTGSLTCVSENTSLNHNNHNNEIGPIAALNLDIKEFGRTLSSNRQLVRSDTETELLAAPTTTIAATEPDVRITNADEREAWRIVKALSLRQKAMIRNSSRLKEMGPLSISANPKSSSTSAGSSADRETDTSPFSHRRLGDLEDDDKSSGKKEKSLFAKKIFEFPEGNKENYVKFENEIEEDVKENRGTQNMGV